MTGDYETLGWRLFPFENSLMNWVAHVRPAAGAAVRDPALRRDWLRCGNTWFVGVNALPNNAVGAVPGGPPLTGAAITFAQALQSSALPLDRAQVSVVWPGYPRQAGESDGAFAFRRDHDAAHIDGVHRKAGPGRRRHIGECHAWLLGLPLTDTGKGASPLVLWEGSHDVMRAALVQALQDRPGAEWDRADITETYMAARRRIFTSCRRIELHAQPGEAYVLHRLTLHGVAPWEDGAEAPESGRMIAYFRPDRPGGTPAWLMDP